MFNNYNFVYSKYTQEITTVPEKFKARIILLSHKYLKTDKNVLSNFIFKYLLLYYPLTYLALMYILRNKKVQKKSNDTYDNTKKQNPSHTARKTPEAIEEILSDFPDETPPYNENIVKSREIIEETQITDFDKLSEENRAKETKKTLEHIDILTKNFEIKSEKPILTVEEIEDFYIKPEDLKPTVEKPKKLTTTEKLKIKQKQLEDSCICEIMRETIESINKFRINIYFENKEHYAQNIRKIRQNFKKAYHVENLIKDDCYKIAIGAVYEITCAKFYKRYSINTDYRGISRGKTDGGIDLIIENKNEIKLVQCKYRSSINTISLEEIIYFENKAKSYIKNNPLEKKKYILEYAVPDKNIVVPKARRYIEDTDDFNLKDIVIKL